MLKKILVLVFFGTFIAQAFAWNPKDELVLTFDYKKVFRFATNQFAVWIEDSKGEHVKTLFVTSYTAGKGWKKRTTSLVGWRKVVGEPIDGISSATPKSGNIAVVWALDNAKQEPVADGTYTLRLEANIAAEAYFEYSATIDIKDRVVTLGEVKEELTGKKVKSQSMISGCKLKVRKSGKANCELRCL